MLQYISLKLLFWSVMHLIPEVKWVANSV